MSRISTPRAAARTTTPGTATRPAPAPRAATLARIRQFARAYAAPVAGMPGFVLN